MGFGKRERRHTLLSELEAEFAHADKKISMLVPQRRTERSLQYELIEVNDFQFT